MTKIFTSNKGRLCNHLYRVLHTHLRGINDPLTTYRYAPPSGGDIARNLSILGFGPILTADTSHSERIGYLQHFNKDFTKHQVDLLVDTFIRSSDIYRQASEFAAKIDQETSIAIHIRNTDYLNDSFSCFDRISYIIGAFDSFKDRDFKDLYVFSDDIEYTSGHYHNLLLSFVPNLHYMKGGSATDDLMRLSVIRNKILFNSTYSVWSAMIGNAIYEDSEKDIAAPACCWASDRGTTIYNPNWNLIPVRITKWH